tara:strand:- start:89 stop:247 length:159 start_codon:yes stop_codon:yes gene_type:complete
MFLLIGHSYTDRNPADIKKQFLPLFCHKKKSVIKEQLLLVSNSKKKQQKTEI